VIVVENGDGPGGLGRGVRISKPGTEPVWKRSLFHGLAQVIVLSRKEAGTVTLKATGNGLATGSTTLKVK
jgi:beta-galactosidase